MFILFCLKLLEKSSHGMVNTSERAPLTFPSEPLPCLEALLFVPAYEKNINLQ